MRSNMWILSAAIGLLVVGCGGKPKAAVAPAPLNNPNSDVGKVDEMGVTAVVDAPSAEPCQRKYASVKRDTFDQCLIEGLTYVQVANMLGRGKMASKAGNTEIWQWSNYGVITATFRDGKMVSKSQSGLQ
jgi:hypothetical protein